MQPYGDSVSGVGERSVVREAGVDGITVSQVSGIGERSVTIVGFGVLTVGQSVVGVSEREITDKHTDLPQNNSAVSGVAERELTDKHTDLTTNNSVAGIAERIITSEQTDLATENYINGVAEREVTSKFADLPQNNSIVGGVSEREITFVSGAGDLDAGSSSVGNGKRTVKLISGISPTESSVGGIGQAFTLAEIATTVRVKVREERPVVAVVEETQAIRVKIKPDIYTAAGRIYAKVA